MRNHIYLSPHLDDVILSCGGLIHHQRSSGETVTVINLCAGIPDYSRLSPFARQYHAVWGDLPDPVASRRTEDKAVLDQLGVTARYGDTPDSIYRRIDGEVAYPDLKALFAEPHHTETVTLPSLWYQELERVCSGSADTTIYASLAAGNHVDHQLVRDLALRFIKDGLNVWFYEDYPHVECFGALHKAQAYFHVRSWQTKTFLIDANAKIAAIQGYITQVPFIFGNEQRMVHRVKRFTAEVACDVSLLERVRSMLVGLDGRRERVWRSIWGYHAHAERIWKPVY